MVNFWENPELIRHVRMEMRPRRMILAATVSVALCLMAWILSAQMNNLNGHSNDKEYLQVIFSLLAGGQAAILILWSFSSCSQAISNERTMKTFDFLRTTRLTSAELLTGMLFGVPVMAYFVTTLTYGISALAGLMGGFPLEAILATYFFLIVVTVVFSLAGLTISMMVAKPRAGIGVMFAFVWAFSILGSMAPQGVFPALQSLLVVPALMPLFGNADVMIPRYVSFFGADVPQWMVTLVLYGSFGAWLIVMLLRNLKREREDIKLLSRWQGIGFAVYMNLLAFGMLDIHKLLEECVYAKDAALEAANLATGGFVVLNFFIFYAVGLTTLSTPERLKHWWRERSNLASYFSDDGPSWPWVVLVAAIALALFAFESSMSPGIPNGKWTWPVWEIVVLLTFAVRDVMFIQWCTLTRMKDAVGKAVAFILLYYFAVVTVLAMFQKSEKIWQRGLAILTPVWAFFGEHRDASLAGAVIQVAITVALGYLIHQRFAKKIVLRA